MTERPLPRTCRAAGSCTHGPPARPRTDDVVIISHKVKPRERASLPKDLWAIVEPERGTASLMRKDLPVLARNSSDATFRWFVWCQPCERKDGLNCIAQKGPPNLCRNGCMGANPFCVLAVDNPFWWDYTEAPTSWMDSWYGVSPKWCCLPMGAVRRPVSDRRSGFTRPLKVEDLFFHTSDLPRRATGLKSPGSG